MTQTTPLDAIHRARQARMVPFAGWTMPVTYTDITTEHHAVRKKAGLFDLCHMGRVRFRGPDADALAHRVQTRNVSKLKVGKTRYALVCEESGGITDDILVSREADALLLVVNAGNREQDLAFFKAAAQGLDVEVADDTFKEAMIAVQGPAAAGVLAELGYPAAGELKYYTHAVHDGPEGELLFSRTGYTGEDGFEIFVPTERVSALWERIEEVGKGAGLIACGLGARDTLRLEAGMPLHGHEIGPEIDPFSAGVTFGITSKQGYRGFEAHQRIRAEGAPRALIGLVADGPRIPRQGAEVLLDDQVVGEVCSGTLSPTLGKNIATALVTAAAAANEGGRFSLRIRRHEAAAERTDIPFYQREK